MLFIVDTKYKNESSCMSSAALISIWALQTEKESNRVWLIFLTYSWFFFSLETNLIFLLPETVSKWYSTQHTTSSETIYSTVVDCNFNETKYYSLYNSRHFNLQTKQTDQDSLHKLINVVSWLTQSIQINQSACPHTKPPKVSSVEAVCSRLEDQKSEEQKNRNSKQV